MSSGNFINLTLNVTIHSCFLGYIAKKMTTSLVSLVFLFSLITDPLAACDYLFLFLFSFVFSSTSSVILVYAFFRPSLDELVPRAPFGFFL